MAALPSISIHLLRQSAQELACLQRQLRCCMLLARTFSSVSAPEVKSNSSRQQQNRRSAGAKEQGSSFFSAILFPVQPASQSARAAAAAAPKLQQPTSHSWKQKQLKHADVQPAMAKTDAFVMGREGQQIAAWLFKASILLISIPFFFYIVSQHLIVDNILSGLKSADPQKQRLALQRITAYLSWEYLATMFDKSDGILMLAGMLNQGLPSDVGVDYISALSHLSQHPSAQQAMIMANMVDALERALIHRWLSPEAHAKARELYLELHAARRLALAEAFGGKVDPRYTTPVAA